MKFSYYNPNLTMSTAFKSIYKSTIDAELAIIDYFKALTGKEFILITNSCRTAIFIGYKAIGITGEVITSPLTCKAAIDPIVESGNKPVFADVNEHDLNINVNDIEKRITENTIAIQAIHLGGVSCQIDKIKQIARNNNLWVIEDCAQSLGSKHKKKYTGAFGDFACFSLSKNAYGIGGGILATDSRKIYMSAKEIIDGFSKTQTKIILFRYLRNILATYRNYTIFNFFHRLLIKARGKKKNNSSVVCQFGKISSAQLKVIATQIPNYKILHSKRKNIGEYYYKSLLSKSLLINSDYLPEDSSYTKFFVYNSKFSSKKMICKLRKKGIEVMHLEHKEGSPYQKKIISKKYALQQNLHNYLRIHDSLLSLPLQENFSKHDINFIIELLIE